MRQKAKQILQKTDVDKLPSLPQSLLALLEICHDDDLPLDRLAALLRVDPALYLRVCVAMHHADIGPDSEMSFTDALSYLDHTRLKSIATNAATLQFFSRINQERTEFIKQHWYHSVLCAHIAEQLSTHVAYPYPDEAYKAGLLHDVGQLILEGAYPNTYTAAFAKLSEDEYFHHMELEEFETTHQEVGAECLRKHGCNPFLADAVMYHHEPATAMLDAHPVAKLVHIANLLGSEHFKESDTEVFEAAESLLGLAGPILLEVLELSKTSVAQIAAELEIELPEDGQDGDTAKQIVSREQNKQLLLAEQVRNIALLDGLHQYVAYCGSDSIEQIIREQCQLLFGMNSCLLFSFDEESQCISTQTLTDHNHLNALSIPLEAGRSLVTDCLLQKTTVNSFDYDYQQLSVIDRQLIDLHNKEGMVCNPLLQANQPVGVIVVAVDEGQSVQLLKQSGLMRQFCHTLATIIAESGRIYDEVDYEAEGIDWDARVHEVAHEMRNPLSIINNYLEILSFKLESDSPAQTDIATIKSEIDRVNSIIRGMTEPEAHIETVSLVDVNALIEELSQIFDSSMLTQNSISLELELDSGLQPITSNANAIKQIYTNLVKNAAEALSANDKILVYTQDNVNVDGSNYIEIAVVDDGPGIPPDILPNLFSPVESTKQGEHAGLGLAIVKNLVGELHGSIRCQSNDKGTSFYVLLPKK